MTTTASDLPTPGSPDPSRFLSRRERRVLERLQEVVIPPTPRLPLAGAEALDRLERATRALGPQAMSGLRGALWTLEVGALPQRGHRFSSLDHAGRIAVLERWRRSPASQALLRVLLVGLKVSYLADEEVYRALGLRFTVPPAALEPERWRENVVAGDDLEPGAELECDVVVVGTGAGGAPMAASLAEKGHAVVLLEAGRYFTRTDFTGRPFEAIARMYERPPAGVLVGNALLPVPLGKTVGGSTTVNSGTCFRTPDAVLRGWGRDFGLVGLSPEAMAPWFEAVERDLDIQPGEMRHIGGPGRVIARGCEALGYSHGPLARNAAGCDAQGLCCFGCPTDAKRSTNVTYVPRAIQSGAMLVTEARVHRVLAEGGRASGVVAAVTRSDGTTADVRVRARVVVLAAGTFHTPVLLMRNGLANGSGQLGRNLSVHPATHAFGLFDEVIDGSRTIPQGYGVDQFAAEGIRFEGASVPVELPGAAMDEFGAEFTDVVERFNHLAAFGFMIKDSSRGRIRVRGGGARPGRGGALGTYWFDREDAARLNRGMDILCRIFFAAGARAVYPGVSGHGPLRSPADVERMLAGGLAPRHFDLSAYHPLGTARMGADPRRSVVGEDLESHDVRDLFVCDGSVVPSSLGVNPQVTIMALALRAADAVHRRLGP